MLTHFLIIPLTRKNEQEKKLYSEGSSKFSEILHEAFIYIVVLAL